MRLIGNSAIIQDLWRPVWLLIGAAPIWLKIMGIVLFPLFIVVVVAALHARQSIDGFLSAQNNSININLFVSFLTGQAVFVVGLALVLGVVLAFVLSRIIQHPLSQLLKVIRRVEAGDYSARVDIWAQDEIGQVQVAFNTMTANLERTRAELLDQNRELAAVNELAEALTLGKGVDAIIEIALTRVLALMQFDVGAIYLFDRNLDLLRLKASRGFLSPDLMRLIGSTAQDNPLFKRLLETGHTIIVEDILSADEILGNQAPLLSKENFASWACAALKMEGEIIGVCYLGKHSKRSFSSHDQALLEIVGNVVGSSISNAQLLKDLRRKEWELRRALHRSVNLQEDERKRLARELHDEVGQALTSILIRLKTIQEEKDLGTIINRLDDLRRLTSQTIEELRRIAIDLRPTALDSLGIIPALRWYVKQSTEMTGVPIKLNAPDRCDRLPPDIELILYRVAQEGITNAIRHGKAHNIEISLVKDPLTIQLTIQDNGQGFDSHLVEHGLGLIGIRERVEMLDGNFRISGSPGAGSQLWIELPLQG